MRPDGRHDRPPRDSHTMPPCAAPASGIVDAHCALRYSDHRDAEHRISPLALGVRALREPAGLRTRCASRRCSRSGETYLRNRRRWCGRCAVRETGSRSSSACPARARPSPSTRPGGVQSSGYRVYGAALAAEAAAQLEAGSQIPSVTLDRLLYELAAPQPCRAAASIPAASWSSTRRAWSTRAVSCGCWRSRNARVQKSCSQVMTGNSPRSEAGGGFGALGRELGATRLGSMRASAEWERSALEALREAEPVRRPRPTPITAGSVARPTR